MSLGYLFAAYTIVIGGLALYVGRLVARLREVDHELDELRRRLGADRPR
jgi:CcmD family protein